MGKVSMKVHQEHHRPKIGESREAQPKKCLKVCLILWNFKGFEPSTRPLQPSSSHHAKLTELFQMFVSLSPSTDHIRFDLAFILAPFDSKIAILAPILAPGISHSL